jgi:recombination protein RecT
MSETQQLSTDKRRDIRDFIQSDIVKNQVALALPHYLTPERMLRICVTSVNRTPKLLECTTESLLGAIMQAAQMGLEPDGRQGHLIPYFNSKTGKTECQFQADYKGLVGLVRRNSDVEDIYADLVRDKDKFEIKKGLHRDLVHEIDIRAERGDVIGAYAVIKYRGGVTGFEFMSKQEIDEIRKRSKSANAGPWVTDFGEMAKKTVIKRLLKLADLAPEVQDRINVDTEININDRVVEIERAQIGNVEPPEHQKPTRKKGKRLPVNETPPAGQQQEPAETTEKPANVTLGPNATEVVKRLELGTYTVIDFLVVAIHNKWIEPPAGYTGKPDELKDVPLASFGEEKLGIFLEDWSTVAEQIDKLRAKP